MATLLQGVSRDDSLQQPLVLDTVYPVNSTHPFLDFLKGSYRMRAALKFTEEELKQLKHELETQDNFCTAEPIYLVQSKRRIYGLDAAYADADSRVWLDDAEGIEASEFEAAVLDTEDEEIISFWGLDEDSYTLTGYVDVWEFVASFLAMRAAEEFVHARRHSGSELRITVESGIRNPEWRKLRQHFLETP